MMKDPWYNPTPELDEALDATSSPANPPSTEEIRHILLLDDPSALVQRVNRNLRDGHTLNVLSQRARRDLHDLSEAEGARCTPAQAESIWQQYNSCILAIAEELSPGYKVYGGFGQF